MRVDGSTPSEKRQSEVSRFQENSSCRVALLSITAANMGINLHAASLVVFAELFWNPGVSFFFGICVAENRNFFFCVYYLHFNLVNNNALFLFNAYLLLFLLPIRI